MQDDYIEIEDIKRIVSKIEELQEILNTLDDDQKKEEFKRLLNRYDYQIKEIQDYLENEEEYRLKNMAKFKKCNKKFVATVAAILTFASVYSLYINTFVADSSLAMVLSQTLSLGACKVLLFVGAYKEWGVKLYNNIQDINRRKILVKKDKIYKELDQRENQIKYYCNR